MPGSVPGTRYLDKNFRKLYKCDNFNPYFPLASGHTMKNVLFAILFVLFSGQASLFASDCSGCIATKTGGALDMVFPSGVILTFAFSGLQSGTCSEQDGNCEQSSACSGTYTYAFSTGTAGGTVALGYDFEFVDDPASNSEGRLTLGTFTPTQAGSDGGSGEVVPGCGSSIGGGIKIGAASVGATVTCGVCSPILPG